ncbi:transcriptional adapter ADA2 isoform X2 [Tripterygium wilfordii]|uniref:transcriptional adapter ADA2 isoform X2 n=1 Tax=Tripterygium wilfordii TaxID=458696 RepID=UPI0018F7F25B|nr:transcriptional adapter ADA2 isoform X2 [Tripterygium wilfordii]
MKIPTIVLQEVCAGKPLYHCNYCNKDLSGLIRIKCAMCPDFDLCIECFSVGAEVTPHKSNHPYRVMDNLSFPLICPDWNADEEMLLLEGIEMYGFGNWTEVAEHVGTRTRSQCIGHYNAVYMNSPCFPVPDMTHVMGKSREELLAMTQRNDDAKNTEVKKEIPMLGELDLKEGRLFSTTVQFEVPIKEDPVCQSSSSQDAGSVKKAAYNILPVKKNIKVEEIQSDRRIGEKKPRLLGDEGPSVAEFSGYNFKRQEFEIEYDNDAEQLLADMEFKETDPDAENEVKLRVLHIYSKRLDERKRRKDFILERNLLYPDQFENNLSSEEKEIYQRFKVFMRFHPKHEHEEFVKSIIEEHRIAKRIRDLQEARAAGCQTMAEVNKFLEQKQQQEMEVNLQQMKEISQMQGESSQGIAKELTDLHIGGNDSSSTIAKQSISDPLDDDWDITGFPGANLLSETEQRLCSEIRILPSHYLNMLQALSAEIMKGNITKKSEAHSLFKVEPSKVDRLFDMLVQKGVAKA